MMLGLPYPRGKATRLAMTAFVPVLNSKKIAADSLLGEFTAAQEGLWTLRGAGPIAMAALQPTNTWVIFEDWLKARLNASGGMLRVNMVASIAGGTGAGLLVHVAQYVRKTAQLANIQVTIQAVVALPSIFNQAWNFRQTKATSVGLRAAAETQGPSQPCAILNY